LQFSKMSSPSKMLSRIFTLVLLCLVVSRTVSAAPTFKIGPIPSGELDVFKKQFTYYLNVFGIHLFGTATTPPAKLRHAAVILAEYLDNNEDGKPDNPMVLKTMIQRKAFLFMTANERALGRLDHEVFQDAGFHHGQGQFATETNPGGDEFDASLEEVLHLVTHEGYANAYPEVFGERPGTILANCLDMARRGHFKRVSRRYPKGAWFTYDDRSCDYGCQCTEYLYWAVTSVLGAQDTPRRRKDIGQEWRLYNRELVKTRDPKVYELITDPKYKLPSRLPDGKYREK
jgi:hypothetical protein